MKSSYFFKGLLKYLIIFICFASLNSVYPKAFGATALYIGLLYAQAPPLVLSIVFFASFSVFNSFEMLLVGLVQAVLIGGLFSLYRIKGKTPKVEIIFFYFTATLPYIIWCGDMLENLVYSAIICLFAFIGISAVGAVNKTVNKAKASTVELVSLSVIFILTGFGGINLLGINAYKSFAVLILLFSIKCLQSYLPYVTAGVLATPLAMSTQNPNYFCILFLWFILSIIFVENNRLFSALGVVLGECVATFLLNLYADRTVIDGICVALPALFFAFLPNSLFRSIDSYFNLDSKEILSYDYINRTRTSLSSKLYEMSGVFLQMENSFSMLSNSSVSPELIIDNISKSAIDGVCRSCVFRERCQMKGFPDIELMRKFVSVGINKNRVSLIDIPREFTEICGYPNSIIFEVNRLIGEFSGQIKLSEERKIEKSLVENQVSSLGKIMKSLAFDMSKTLNHNAETEKRILEFMKRQGLPISGLLILGENERTEFNVFATAKVLSKKRFLSTLSTAIGAELCPIKTQKYNDNLVTVTYKKAPELDAIFGVSSVTKNGSPCSGDIHTLIKIDEGRFLVALSDGMGSGESALRTSSSCLNLIESYYRAGLDSQSILRSVNKILALNSKDCFSAVDLSIINLYESQSDFIKIGAPYGFVVSNEGVRFVEGSSLPLGILDEINPSTANLALQTNDVIVLLSDGVTDAFGSSSEMVEFLRSSQLKNPQELADNIIQKAIYMSGGIAQDDMTALCVRIINKVA